MPKEVELDGVIYEVPDDATDEEILALVGSAQPSAISPEASRSSGERFVRGLGSEVGGGLRDIGSAFKRFATHPGGPQVAAGELASQTALGLLRPLTGMPSAARAAMRGDANDAARQFTESLPILGPVAQRAREHEAEEGSAGTAGRAVGAGLMMLLPAGLRGAGRATTGAARAATKKIVGTPETAVADAAIQHRLLPGFLRKGPSKAARVLRSTSGSVSKELEGSAGAARTQGLTGGGAAIHEAMDATTRPGRRSAIAEPTAEGIRLMQSRPTAREAFRLSEDYRGTAAGKTTDTAVGERAVSRDIRSRVGQAAPSVTGRLRVIDEVAPVAEAYARPSVGGGGRGKAISSEGVGLQTGMTIAFLNRLLGPATQWTGDLGRLMTSRGARGTAQGARAATVIGDDSPEAQAILDLLRQSGLEDAMRAR